MNIYLFEVRSQLKNFLIWTVSILAAMFIFMSALYPAFMQSQAAVEQAYSGFPPAFAAAFGIVISQIFTYWGFYQFIYTYLAIIGAIMAASIALSAFAREKRSKCVDFLLTKPVSRGRIFTTKLLACLSLILVVNLLFVAMSIIAYFGNGQDPAQLGTLIWGTCALFFMQLVFLAIGIVFATFAGKVRSVSGIATGLGFGGFILSALYSILHEEAIRFISPLTYFEPYFAFTKGGFEAKYVVTAAVVFVLCLCLSYAKYSRSDTPAL